MSPPVATLAANRSGHLFHSPRSSRSEGSRPVRRPGSIPTRTSGTAKNETRAPYRCTRRATPYRDGGKWGQTHRGIGGIAVEAWRQASPPRAALSERTTNTNKLDCVRFGGWRRTHGSTRWAAWPIECLGDGCHAVFALNRRSKVKFLLGSSLLATVALSVALLVAPREATLSK
jgi:hypothetical protein